MNITENIIAKERLAAVDEIIVTVNHKINNPLTTIINYAELLQINIENPNMQKIKKSIEKILDAAQQIKRVTHQLSTIDNTNRIKYVDNISMINLSD